MYIPSQLNVPHSQSEEDFDRIHRPTQSNFPSYAYTRSNLENSIQATNERSLRLFDFDDRLDGEAPDNYSISQPLLTYANFDQTTFNHAPNDHSMEATTRYLSPSNTVVEYNGFARTPNDPYHHIERISDSIIYEEPEYDDEWGLCPLGQKEDDSIQNTEPVPFESAHMYDNESLFSPDFIAHSQEPETEKMLRNDPSHRPFKSYVLASQKLNAVGRWNPQEHEQFLQGLEIFKGPAWGDIAKLIGTRSSTQVRTHAQKFFTKLARSNRTFPHFEGHIDRERQRLAGQGALKVASSLESIKIGAMSSHSQVIANRWSADPDGMRFTR